MKSKTINSKIVRYVGTLAKISLTPKEVIKFTSQFGNVLEFFNKVSQLKTKGSAGTYQVTNINNRFREDKIDKSNMLTQKQALSNAKKTHQGYFVVKSIFK